MPRPRLIRVRELHPGDLVVATGDAKWRWPPPTYLIVEKETNSGWIELRYTSQGVEEDGATWYEEDWSEETGEGVFVQSGHLIRGGVEVGEKGRPRRVQ